MRRIKINNSSSKKNCSNCKHWTKTNEYKNGTSEGSCNIINNKVYIDISYGWDGGHIIKYETDGDFYCNLWELKEE